MAGKGTEAGIGTRAWVEGLRLRLAAEVERGVQALQDSEITKGDLAGIDRHFRCVANAARAGKLLAALAPGNEDDEAEMSDDDRGGEPEDPAELERLGAELQSRLDRLRSTIERKRVAGWTYNPRTPESDCGDAGPS